MQRQAGFNHTKGNIDFIFETIGNSFFFSSKVLNTTHCIKKWKKRTCFPPEAVMNEWKGRGGMSGNVTSGLWRNRNGWDTAARLRKKIESTFTRLMWYFMLKMVFSNLSIHVFTIYSSSTWSQKINSIRRIGMASFSRKVELIFQWSGWECQSEGVKFSSNGYYELCKTLALSQFKRGKFLATCQSRSRKQYYFLLTLKIAKFFPKENLIWPWNYQQ